jgi:hypothetical protein
VKDTLGMPSKRNRIIDVEDTAPVDKRLRQTNNRLTIDNLDLVHL